MTKKETLHPKNNPQDDIYPKTSIDQVEELDGRLLEISENLSSIDDSLDSIEETLALKADKSDTYTKTEINNSFSAMDSDKADRSDTYTKTQVDNALALKADKSDTYTKTQVDNELALKADKSDTYTKTQVDTLLLDKQNKLTAGTGISIANDGTISATGGGYTYYLHKITVTDTDLNIYYFAIILPSSTPIETEQALLNNYSKMIYGCVSCREHVNVSLISEGGEDIGFNLEYPQTVTLSKYVINSITDSVVSL